MRLTLSLFVAEVTAARDWPIAETGEAYRGELRSVGVGRAYFEVLSRFQITLPRRTSGILIGRPHTRCHQPFHAG
jgi:hypothetical protein